MRDDTERIRDIEECLEKIDKYSIRGEKVFYEDELIQTWIIHNLQIIGEASRATSEAFKVKYSQLDWQDMADFRNLIVHEYFRVNLKIVWSIVKNELPKLKQQVNDILRDIKSF